MTRGSTIRSVLLLALLALSCGAAEVRLAWDLPTNNVDGTPLTDLAGCRVGWNTDSNSWPHWVDVGIVTTARVAGLPGRVEHRPTAVLPRPTQAAAAARIPTGLVRPKLAEMAAAAS